MKLIKNWATATFILCFLVIIAGGVVRTTQSGMGCPDWPKCFGKWIPPTNASQLPADFEKYLRKQDIDHTFNALHTWIEYINRLFGAMLGLFAIIQTALLFFKRESKKKAYQFSIAFLCTVILTGLFGAIVVKLNLANASISVHLLFAIILLQIQLGVLLCLNNKLFYLQVDNKTRQLFFAFLILLFIQSILGTGVRMYVDNVSKILHYQQRETWLANTPVAFLIHRSFSWIVFLSTIILFFKTNQIASLKIKSILLLVTIALNVVFGIILFYANMPAIAQPIHLLLASLAITETFSILLQTKK